MCPKGTSRKHYSYIPKLFICTGRLRLNVMTLKVSTPSVNTSEGVAISVNGIAQVVKNPPSYVLFTVFLVVIYPLNHIPKKPTTSHTHTVSIRTTGKKDKIKTKSSAEEVEGGTSHIYELEIRCNEFRAGRGDKDILYQRAVFSKQKKVRTCPSVGGIMV